MDHTPFIMGSYAAAAVILAWCALAPLVQMRRVRRELIARAARSKAAR